MFHSCYVTNPHTDKHKQGSIKKCLFAYYRWWLLWFVEGYLTLSLTITSEMYYYFPFTDEKTAALRCDLTCPRSIS